MCKVVRTDAHHSHEVDEPGRIGINQIDGIKPPAQSDLQYLYIQSGSGKNVECGQGAKFKKTQTGIAPGRIAAS